MENTRLSTQGLGSLGAPNQRLYNLASFGLADWAPPTPYRPGRAVRGITGAARPHAVIHWNAFNQLCLRSCEKAAENGSLPTTP